MLKNPPCTCGIPPPVAAHVHVHKALNTVTGGARVSPSQISSVGSPAGAAKAVAEETVEYGVTKAKEERAFGRRERSARSSVCVHCGPDWAGATGFEASLS